MICKCFQEEFIVQRVSCYWLTDWIRILFGLFRCKRKSKPVSFKADICSVLGRRMTIWTYLHPKSIFEYSFHKLLNEIQCLYLENLCSLPTVFWCRNICFKASSKYLCYSCNLIIFNRRIFLMRTYTLNLFDSQYSEYR